jgi:hypothetical protein
MSCVTICFSTNLVEEHFYVKKNPNCLNYWDCVLRCCGSIDLFRCESAALRTLTTKEQAAYHSLKRELQANGQVKIIASPVPGNTGK